MTRRAALLAAVALCPLATATAVPAGELQPSWVIAPGAEQRVQAWLQPLAEDAEVADGWTLRNIAIDRTALRLELQKPGQPPQSLALLPPDATAVHAQAPLVQCPPALAPEVCAAVRARLAHHTLRGSPWQQVAPPPAPRPPPAPTPPLRQPLRLAVLALWALLLAASALAERQWHRDRPSPRPFWGGHGWLGLAAVTLSALVARLQFAPRTLLHEYYHADLTTRAMAEPDVVAEYGEAIQTPMLLLDRLGHSGVDGLFALNLALAVLSVPVWQLLDEALFGPRRSTWLTGFFCALLPLYVRYSACEEPFPAIAVLLGWSLLWWCRALTTWRWSYLLASLGALGLAMELRPEWLAAPAFHVLFAWVLCPGRVWRHARHPALWLVVAAAGLFAVSRRHILGGRQVADFQLARLVEIYAPLDPANLFPLFTVLILAGGLWTWRHQRARLLLLLLPHAALTAACLLPFMTVGNLAFRMQILPSILLMPIAARAADFLSEGRLRRWALLLPMLAAVAHFALHRSVMLAEGTQQAEWRFLQETATQLPANFRLLAHDGRTNAIAGFPLYVLERAGRRAVQQELTTALQTDAWPPPGPDLIVYLGMSCWLEHPGDRQPPPVLRDGCAAARRHYVLEPLVSRTLPAIPYAPAVHYPAPPGGYPVGYFRAIRLQ